MADIDILKQLFDKKILRIIDVFLQNRDKQFYLRELGRAANVSPATTYRIVGKLVKAGIIEEIKISKFKVYKIIVNEKTKGLTKLLKKEVNPLEIFVEKAKELDGIDSIILQGKKTNKSANILIIGKDDVSKKVDGITSDIKQKHNFNIDFLILSEQQFKQMTKLGVYSGEKRTLWERIKG
ncbi:MAG: winged helix-turn-helix domain-containing protein [Nanoarchaeota archaeon]|nr:winged helix-turn-helix domain-containing protein [Nanoarchaeota archaeon]